MSIAPPSSRSRPAHHRPRPDPRPRPDLPAPVAAPADVTTKTEADTGTDAAASGPGPAPELHIDHVLQAGSAFAVVGWTIGDVTLSALRGDEALAVRLARTHRPDVASHFGLGDGQCAGFFLEVDTPGPWTLQARCDAHQWHFEEAITQGEPAQALRAVLSEHAALGIDTGRFGPVVQVAGRTYRREDTVAHGIGGHIEISLLGEDGTAAFVGWATDSPAHALAIVAGGAALPLADCYRFPRPDIQPVFHEALGLSSGPAGFAGVLRAGPGAADAPVEVLLLDDETGTARPLPWQAELHRVAAEELPRRLAHVWTDPADLQARIARVEGRMPLGRRPATPLVPRWVGPAAAPATSGPALVVLWRRPTRLLAALAPVIAHAGRARPREVLVVPVGLDGETFPAAEAEALSTLVGAPVGVIDGAADAPLRSLLALLRARGGLRHAMVIDTRAAVELQAFHASAAALDDAGIPHLLLARSSVRDLLGLPFGSDLSPAHAASGYEPFGLIGNLAPLADGDSPWLDAACWCFDAIVQGLANEGAAVAQLRLAGILGAEPGGELPFPRQLQRRRYLALAGRPAR